MKTNPRHEPDRRDIDRPQTGTPEPKRHGSLSIERDSRSHDDSLDFERPVSDRVDKAPLQSPDADGESPHAEQASTPTDAGGPESPNKGDNEENPKKKSPKVGPRTPTYGDRPTMTYGDLPEPNSKQEG